MNVTYTFHSSLHGFVLTQQTARPSSKENPTKLNSTEVNNQASTDLENLAGLQFIKLTDHISSW